MRTATAAHIKDPFSKRVDQLIDVPEGATIKDLATMFHNREINEFDAPTICILNGTPVMRSVWGDFKPQEGDTVIFATVVGDLGFIPIIIGVVMAGVSLVLTLSIDPPKMGNVPEPDPTYKLRGQTNKIRLGDPIEDHYGKVRVYPSYAAVSYNKYIDNEQYLYSLFCVGQGEYVTEEPHIGDTPVSNFDDLEYQYYGPNEAVDLFRDNVDTSTSVGNIELFASNEPEYPAGGWVGPFSCSGPGTSADIIEIDVVLPQGLYYSNDDGGLSNRTITAEFEYRLVGTSTWLTLESFSKTLRTNTPQRYTFTRAVAPGRYEMRARRTNLKDTSHRAGNIIRWETMRAFLPNVSTYGDVTLLAIRARASNSLNDNSKDSINLFATRKLPIWNGVSWDSPVATRSAVWALLNIFRSNHGGNLTDDQYYDLEEFLSIDATLTSEGRNFDWTFDTRSTVWESAETIGRAVRGKPMLNGSLITMILERPKTLPVAVFGPNNIIENSFVWDIKIRNQNEHDGIEMEYVDPVTWKPEVVECFLDDSDGDFLEPIKIPGVTDRDIAYREGMYEEAKRKYQRENITFSTGLEGYIPAWGDLIMLHHDVPNWSQSGLIIGISGSILTLDTEPTFGVGTHKIFAKNRFGEVSGPHTVTAVSGEPKKVEIQGAFDASVFNLSYPEKPIFLFGVEDLEGKLLTVVDIRSKGREEVEVVGVNYDSRVYGADSDTAVAKPPPPSVISNPGLPDVLDLTLGLSEEGKVVITWSSIRSARFYRVQYSDDGVNYPSEIQTSEPKAVIDVPYLPIYIRVAAVADLGQGPWSGATYSAVDAEVYTPVVPASIGALAGYGSIQLYWDNQGAGADKYQISVTDADPSGPNPDPIEVDAETNTNSYMFAGLGDQELKYFQVRATKTLPSGTVLTSAWSSAVSASTNQVVGNNFYGATPPPPSSGQGDGSIWFDTDDNNKIYVWDASAGTWNAAESEASIAPGKTITVVSSLPALPDSEFPDGAQVALSTDGYRLYRNDGGSWTSSVNASDISGQLTDAQLAEIAAAKISGQLTDTQLAEIAAAKISGELAETQIAAEAITAAKIAAGAITAGKLAAGVVTATEIAAEAITAAKIAAGAITAGKIAAGSITSEEIAANTIKASNVVISANANLLGDRELRDENFWTMQGVGSMTFEDSTSGWDSERLVNLTSNIGEFTAAKSPTFEFEPETIFRVKFQGQTTPASTLFAFGQLVTSASPDMTSNETISTAVLSSSGIIQVDQDLVPPNPAHRFAYFRLISQSDVTTSKFGGVSLRSKTGGSLIVDGAITAGKINAGAITADKIAANAITADKVGANQIITNAANIADAIITDAKIANLSAGKITAGTISSAIIKLLGTGGAIQSDNFISGSDGFRILGNGSAEFSDITIRGNMETGTIVLDGDGVGVINSGATANISKARPVQLEQQNNVGSGVIFARKLHGWTHASGSTSSRVVVSDCYVEVSFACAPTSSGSGSWLTAKLQYRANGGVWTDFQISYASISSVDDGGIVAQGAQILPFSGTSEYDFRFVYSHTFQKNVDGHLMLIANNWS